MTYDVARRQVVLFGGMSPNRDMRSDTWVWDGSNWTQRSPGTSPAARYSSALAYDAARGQVVLFGGTNDSTFNGDTWVWDGSSWSQKFPANSPPGRSDHSMAYDAARGQVVLFGGYNGTSSLNDTWVWDGSNWTQKSPTNIPTGRAGGQFMTYDSSRNQVVLVSGYITLDDTWVWDGSNWQEKLPATRPPKRWYGAIAYEAAQDQVVYFGGYLAPGSHDDTWVWNGSTWTQKFPTARPPARQGHAMAYDAAHDQVVLFGGVPNGGPTFGDTWVWNGTSPSSTQKPLIFIPGIAGSSLNKERVGPDNNVWPYPSLTGVSFNDLTLDPAYSPPSIIAIDAIRAIPGKKVYGPLLDMLKTRGGYREYKVNGDTLRRTTAGCDMSQQPDQPNLFVFAYDWRFSSATNAQMLKDYVGCIQRFYPGTEVDILTHSMGGLVARRYILDNPSPHVVNKMITIAAPWLGAPKAINALETGLFFDGFLDRINSGVLKRLVEFFPGVHQLNPSRGYYALGGLPFTEYQWDADGNRTVDGTYTDYTRLLNMLDYRYPNPASRPGTRGKIFHDHPGQDNWNVNETGLNPDPTINYFHIYGRQPAPMTIGNVYTRLRTKCNLIGNCRPAFGYDVRKTYGDGTVPLFSASRMGNGHNFNALNATLAPVNTPEDHTALAQSKGIHDYILSVLRPAGASMTGLTSTKSEHGQTITSIGLAVEEQAYYLNISGPASVTVTDAFGHSNAPADGSVFGGEVPGVTTDMLDAESFFIAMSTANTYTVTLRTGTEPIVLELTKGTDTETVLAIRYLDVVLPANVTAMLRVTPQGVDDLRYDGNSDGTFETVVTPTVSVSGATAQDAEPPVVTIAENRQSQNLTIVTVSATDSGSGVKKINYSLDGTNYQTYSAPFSVDPYRVRKIYTFADDNVANRSGLVEFQLTAPPPIVMVEQGMTSRAVALDSVTWLRAPFPILNNYNLSVDRHTRVILFISGVALTQADLSIVTVHAAGIALPVENVGTVSGLTGLNGSYIVVRLPDGLPSGELPLTIGVGGVMNTNSVTLGISP